MVAVILKVTKACNSNCAYCDVVSKDRRQTATMSLEVLRQTFIRLNEFLLGRPQESAEVIWHGGEPLLAGPAFFTAALAFQTAHCAATFARVHHAVQTNLTRFSPTFVPLFRQLGIGCVGTSYDPIPNLRGPGRAQRSDVYNEQFMRGAALLDAAGLGWGVICVVTKQSLAAPLDVFYFLTNLRPNGGVSFNPVLLYGDDPGHLAVTPEEYVDFLGAIFPVWWQHRHRYEGVEPFRPLTTNLTTGGLSLGCADSGVCAKSYVNIAPDGTASLCGRSGDWGLLKGGSIFERSLSSILADGERAALLERDGILAEGECRDCRFWTICHGGCPLDSWAATKSFMHKTPWCYARSGFIEKYFEPITGIRFDPKSPPPGR